MEETLKSWLQATNGFAFRGIPTSRGLSGKASFLICSFVANVLFALPYSNPEHLEQFNATNQCVLCDLSGANLAWTKHQKAELFHADLSRALLKSAFFGEANFAHASLIDAMASNAHFTLAVFDEANLSRMNARSSYFSGASFKNANLYQANFSRANLSNADLSQAVLKDVDFSHAILIGAHLTAEQLKEIKNLECAVLPNGRVFNPNHSICKGV